MMRRNAILLGRRTCSKRSLALFVFRRALPPFAISAGILLPRKGKHMLLSAYDGVFHSSSFQVIEDLIGTKVLYQLFSSPLRETNLVYYVQHFFLCECDYVNKRHSAQTYDHRGFCGSGTTSLICPRICIMTMK